MPQAILPLFSDDMIIINNHFAVRKKDNVIYWYQYQGMDANPLFEKTYISLNTRYISLTLKEPATSC